MRSWPLLLLAACTREDDAAPAPIVVYLVVDTLGESSAAGTGFCDALGAVAAAHGTTVACVGGAIAPSSWTGESHTRMLWPQHLEGARRARDPECGTEGALVTIARQIRGELTIGAQNRVIGDKDADCDDGNAWFAGAAEVYRGERAGADEPVADALATLLDATARGEPAVALLNTLEPGAHLPRCTDDPDTAACNALWALAAEYEIVAPDLPAEERAEWWSDGDNYFRLYSEIETRGDEARAAESSLDAIAERILARRPATLVERLEVLLGTLEGQGRLDDLSLVVTSDHGENPCHADPVSGQRNCAHTGAPSEWTAAVPVAVIPADRAAQWQAAAIVGDAATPWSTANLAWGLAAATGTAIPDDWPPMPAIGAATSWSCKTQSRHPDGPSRFGVHVVGDRSLRCTDGVCGAYSWTVPLDALHVPAPIEPVPADLAPFAGPPDWTTIACSGP